MEGHAQKCVARYCELANTKTEQVYKVSHPSCLDDHQIKKEELENKGERPDIISYIHFTSDYRQYCHVGNAAQLCRLGLLQDCRRS